MRTTPSCRADLGYIRNRDEGRCRVGRCSSAHIIAVDPLGQLHVEIQTENTPPRWYAISPRMRPNEVAKEIRKCETLAPVLKATYLQLMDAANGKGAYNG